MPDKNFLAFRSLLWHAIGSRTQAQFANEAGISAEHLNRMLNASKINRPTKKTLRRPGSCLGAGHQPYAGEASY